MTNDQQCKIIGLTGPIGAGKDEVAKTLRQKGALVIDADEVAHTLYNTQSPVWHELVRTFGSKILKRGGTISRKRLGEIVFSDKGKLQELDRIVHPYLKEAIREKLESCKSSAPRPPSTELGTSRSGQVVSCPPAGRAGKLIVINAAVLKEIGLVDYVDEVWVVMASKEIRLRRLMKMGLSKEEAAKRIQSQVPQEEYVRTADVIIRNDGTLMVLKKRVLSLL